MSKPVVGVHRDQHGAAGVVILRELVTCPVCGQVVTMLVNRDGCTRCVACDQRYVEKKDQ